MQPGAIVGGKYRVVRELGSGGMGYIVLAEHLDLRIPVALKCIHGTLSDSRISIERFLREARAAARLRNPHVCQILDVGRDSDGLPFIAMEYLEGQDLRELVDARGPIPVEDAVEYVLQACEALAEAHAIGIVHRDLKPGNLFLCTDYVGTPLIKVLDFGISKVPTSDWASGRLTESTDLIGTPMFMSPEQIKSAAKADARSDIWSLGVLLYFLLTAQLPFRRTTFGDTCIAIASQPPDPPAFPLPNGVASAILRCMEKNPEQRFASVLDLATALAKNAGRRGQEAVARIRQLATRRPDTPLPDDLDEATIRAGEPLVPALAQPPSGHRPDDHDTLADPHSHVRSDLQTAETVPSRPPSGWEAPIRPPSVVPQLQQPRRAGLWVWVAAGLVAIAIGLVLVLAWR